MAELVTAMTEPLVLGQKSSADITREIGAHAVGQPTALWYAGFGVALAMLGLGAAAVWYLFITGVGTWGLNRSIGWAFDLTNFVFWIGIGHAGTLISAILYLFRQPWRTAVNRSAEMMTIIAIACAGLFPLIHLGRSWLFFWALPYPNTRGSLWINFSSPLTWDLFAISTYLTVSVLFFYLGLMPDLASMRDRTTGWRSRVFGAASLGWNGSQHTWARWRQAYTLLAGLATPLVISVHSVVSFDFATSILPGWHTTIFPPYFVAGAIFSGMAMVLTLTLIMRKAMALESFITLRHIDAMARLTVATSCMVGLAYATEAMNAVYTGNDLDTFNVLVRASGPLSWAFWTMLACNVLVPQLFWVPAMRRRISVVFAVSVLVNVGMWLERLVIIVSSLERDFLPASWADYMPTRIEVAILIGGFGLFFTCFLLFCRFVPVIAMSEIKEVTARSARGQEREP